MGSEERRVEGGVGMRAYPTASSFFSSAAAAASSFSCERSFVSRALALFISLLASDSCRVEGEGEVEGESEGEGES